MRRLLKNRIYLAGLIIICLSAAGIAIAMSSDNYDLPWTTSGGGSSGGGDLSSTNYQLTDVMGQTGPGTSSSTNYRLTGGFLSIMPIESGTGTMVKVYVALQGDNRPSPEGWQVPLKVCFCPEFSDDNTLLNPGIDVPCFSGTANAEWYGGGTRATVTVGPVKSGTYDITADISTTLLNVKRSVHIP